MDRAILVRIAPADKPVIVLARWIVTNRAGATVMGMSLDWLPLPVLQLVSITSCPCVSQILLAPRSD
jgi:hypothetical protein